MVQVLQIGGLGPMEMGIILLIAVLLFGANKIPKLARSTGQAMGEFQRGRQQVEEELQQMNEGGAAGSAEVESTVESADSEETSSSEEATETEE